MSRRSKGEGSIQTIKKDNKVTGYKAGLVIGYNEKGNPIRKTKTCNTKREAIEWLAQMKNQKTMTLDTKSQLITLTQFAVKWLLEYRYDHYKVSTIERYEGIIRNYIQESKLGNMRLVDIRLEDIEQYYSELLEKGVSVNVIKNLNKTLKAILKEALRREVLVKNPAELVRLPKATIDRDKYTHFTEEEQIKLVKEAVKHRMGALFLLALGTGIRQGELLALTWDDVNFKSSQITISKSVKKVGVLDRTGKKKYGWVTQEPKTKSAFRTLPVPSPIIEVLHEYKENQELEKAKYGELYLDNNIVFCTELGLLIDTRNLTRSYKRLLQRANIEYRNFHSLRHTYATRLFEQGVAPKKVQALMGHADLSTTMNIYTHVISQDLQDDVKTLDYLFK